jgi:hypothetical protein
MPIERKERCPACGVRINRFHETGCDQERCGYCGHQAGTCECMQELWGPRFRASRIPWTGYPAGVTECWTYGFWCRYEPGQYGGWIQCAEGDPGAREDINRLLSVCEWDRVTRHWILPAERPQPKRESILRLRSSDVLLVVRAERAIKVGNLLSMFPESRKLRTELRLRAILESLQDSGNIQICKDVALDSDDEMDLVVKPC